MKNFIKYSFFVALGITSIYYLRKAYLKYKEKQALSSDEKDINQQTTTVIKIISPFASKEEVMAFQDWLDQNHPGWLFDGTSLNKDIKKGYGNFGKQTASAFQKWGKEYLSYLAQQQSESNKKTYVYTKNMINYVYYSPFNKDVKKAVVANVRLGEFVEAIEYEPNKYFYKVKLLRPTTNITHVWIKSSDAYLKKE